MYSISFRSSSSVFSMTVTTRPTRIRGSISTPTVNLTSVHSIDEIHQVRWIGDSDRCISSGDGRVGSIVDLRVGDLTEASKNLLQVLCIHISRRNERRGENAYLEMPLTRSFVFVDLISSTLELTRKKQKIRSLISTGWAMTAAWASMHEFT